MKKIIHDPVSKLNGEKLGFFFGAGTSIEFGVPSMKVITSNFAKKLSQTEDQDEIKTFMEIFNIMEQVYKKGNVDLEMVMSVINGLKDQHHIKDNIGDLGLFMLERKNVRNPSSIFKTSKKVLDSLEIKFKEHIRDSVVLKPSSNIDRMRKAYFDFFKQLCSVTNCANPTPDFNTDEWANTHQKWVFFTTNYDNSLEDYWLNFRKYTFLDLGFYRESRYQHKIMHAEEFVQNNASNNKLAMQLVKLHGSINWVINDHHKIEEHELNLNTDQLRAKSGTGDIIEDVMIYPLAQKHLYFTPFIQLFRILGAELNKRDIWIIIGYSFRDSIIRNMFEKSLEDNKKKMLVVHPHPEQIKNLFSQKIKNQIICLKCYFGRDRDYKKVNKKIAQALLSLSK